MTHATNEQPTGLLTLAMIVKDAGQNLVPLLESAAPWVDEMVIADTGSSDDTTEIVVEAGRVVGIRCKPMELGAFDRSGRRRPVSDGDADFIIPCDQVIAAIGQSVDLPGITGGVSLNVQRNGYVATEALTKQTSEDWIFAGGDVATGPSSVIEAVADGEKAAAGIDQFLTGKDNAFWREEKKNDTAFDPDAEPVTFERERQPLIPVERRQNNFDEVEQPWDEATAIRQAKRCLRCDYREEVHTW